MCCQSGGISTLALKMSPGTPRARPAVDWHYWHYYTWNDYIIPSEVKRKKKKLVGVRL